MKWFVAYDGKLDNTHAQFGPLASMEAAARVRAVIELLEGHEDLWIVQDDTWPFSYDRDLTVPRAVVRVRDVMGELRQVV